MEAAAWVAWATWRCDAANRTEALSLASGNMRDIGGALETGCERLS